MSGSIRFEEFALDLDRYELRRAGRAVKLERMPMELLILLLESDGKLVRRDAINRRLWGEQAQQDTEHSVNTAVNKLRFILRDDPRDPRFIQTVVGQGYRFIAKVAAEPEPAVESQDPLPLPPTEPAAPGPPQSPASVAPPPIRRPRWEMIVLGAAASLAVAIGVFVWHSRQPISPEAAGFHSLAVLPFANLAPNAEQDYIVDGMTDQLITDLAGSTPLRVISRSSAMHYKATQADIKEIARELHVDAVLEGSFLHTGSQVRITANLIDTRNDRHLWAQRYVETGDDLLSMQESVTNDIVRQVASALGTNLSISSLCPVNIKARDAYLRGQFDWNKRTPDSVEKAIAYYRQAVEADPEYAEAYAAMGDAYVLLSGYQSLPPATALARAQEAAEHALRLGGGLAEAHTVLGAIKTDRDWDWPGAEAEYRRALALNPSYPTAHHWLSLHFARLGKIKQAEEEIQKAQALDPLSSIIATDAAETAYWAHNPGEALQRIDAVLATNPAFAEAHLVKGKILEQLGRYEQALAEFKDALMLFGVNLNVEALRAHALALAGASEQALSIARQLEAADASTRVSSVDIGAIYCALGQSDTAARWFDRAYRTHDKRVDMLGIDPIYDGCRNDARFQALIKMLKL